MQAKETRRRFVGVMMILGLAAPAAAQLVDLAKFKGVQIPYTMKFEDKVFEKGKYDLEALKDRNNPTYFLRFKKSGKVICMVEGEQLTVESRGMSRMSDKDIPDNPRLKMKKNATEKKLIFTVETGRRSQFPFQMLQFKLEYEE
jgi:hypothetical protein